MGYSKSTITVQKLYNDLAPLERGQVVTWTATVQTADKYAYKIREALRIAEANPALYPELSKARARYRIQVQGAQVIAIPIVAPEPIHRAVVPPPTAREHASQQVSPRSTVAATLAAENVIPEAFTIEEIITHWLAFQPTETPLRIQKVEMTNGELQELALWASKLEPRWMVINPPATATLILQPHNPLIRGISRIKHTSEIDDAAPY